MGRTLGEDGLLAAQLLEHLGCTSQPIAALANADVENQLLNLELLHRVAILRAGAAARGANRRRQARRALHGVRGGLWQMPGALGQGQAPRPWLCVAGRRRGQKESWVDARGVFLFYVRPGSRPDFLPRTRTRRRNC